MTAGLQASLFDVTDHGPAVGSLGAGVSRTELTDGAWVDVRPGWLHGSIDVFDALHADVPWRAEERRMYDATVTVPRLLAMYLRCDQLPHPILDVARDALSEHYRAVLPGGFETAGLCLYRDGSDSVAWHGDRIGRGRTQDTLVAIVSLGAPRPLLLRPRGGGASRKFVLGSGDLVVMGGSCQRTWEHSVPKVSGVGPRISVQLRPAGVF
ncbi:alpha-ketoglutarate-dependent dioxygenase AlkB [Gordonia liuliyuniae]|uniref:Alpha-ketoglutarate-dependent dioxygenase AlkB n=1 Tax=Gordonia liuliyuniae TaxID=2911517 RepID=A0ABS9IMR7_9ACTN|nr:alpha-ketoglutarate-dependent dioxygenase AlkB [Gordonia liuliyuniae]MCF8586852.1 alpha-ketoglutarate-dependent dioxygenase AlkB [Gordonia liuliyuniae]